MFESTHFANFSDFKKHDFLRFFWNGVLKSRKKSLAKVSPHSFEMSSHRVARGSKFQDPTRPGPRKSWPDPTRPDDYPWWAKKALLLHDAHCPTIAPMWPAARERLSASTLRTYQVHVPSVRVHRDLHAVAALFCFQIYWTVTTECRLTCTPETSVIDCRAISYDSFMVLQ